MVRGTPKNEKGKSKKEKAERLVLIDANAIIHRAFHALPPLSSPSGEPTNAVYGFTTILLRIFREMQPDYMAAAFDLPRPTFRHIAYEAYKATRPKTADELVSQMPRAKEMLRAFGIPVFEKEGFEADDIIGTIADRVRKEHPAVDVVIVTGDMDTLQLVDRRTSVWTMKKGISDTVLYDEQAVEGRFGIAPSSLPDYKGLRGDPSDNIIGVKGIGEKTASELIGAYGTLEKLYAALAKNKIAASEAVRRKLQEGKEDAFFSRTLATIRRDVPLTVTLSSLAAPKAEVNPSLEHFFRELGFFSLLQRLSGNRAGSAKEAVPRVSAQGSLLAGVSLPGIAEFRKAIKKKLPQEAVVAFNAGRQEALCVFSGGGMFALRARDCAEKEARLFFEGAAAKYVFDAKPLYKFLFACGVSPSGVFDFLLAAYLLHPGQAEYSREELFSRELGLRALPGKEEDILRAYFNLGKALKKRLREESLEKVYADIEMPLVPVLAEMELRGIRLDTQWLAALSKKIRSELVTLTSAIYRDAGEEFNINSSRQVAAVLFTKIGIGVKGIRKTGGGKISTKFSELSKLVGRHPIVGKILRHRELAKLKTTYVDALPAFLGKDGRLHTTYNQVRTETGRLASENPNLQNIPVRGEMGREVRKAFIADKGWLLASFDYSQVELRIAADLAGDEKLIGAFERGIDIHALTASEVNNIPLSAVTPELRRKAKALNFGVLYGMGARGFAESAGIGIDEAEAFIEEYFSDFKGIAAYMEKTKDFARAHGFAATAFGRKRYLPGITSSHPAIRSESERMAVNMPVQGTAADIMKLAMIEVARVCRAEFPEEARILLQIHDELVCEVREGALGRAEKRIQEAMEGAWKGKVHLRVDTKKGKNWAELT